MNFDMYVKNKKNMQFNDYILKIYIPANFFSGSCSS